MMLEKTKLENEDGIIIGRIAIAVAKYWRVAWNEITHMLKREINRWCDMSGTMELGAYVFFEHLYHALRNLDGFDPYEFLIKPFDLVSHVFIDREKKAVELGGQEFSWVSKQLEGICTKLLYDMPPTEREREKRKMVELVFKVRGAQQFGVMQVLLKKLSNLTEEIDPYNHRAFTEEGLEMMYDTLAVMHSRVTKLELDLSAITRV
jgi:hypothetical protein